MHLVRISALTLAICSTISAQGFVDNTINANLVVTTPESPFGSASRGAATADFDLDGDLDFMRITGASSPIEYYTNDGTGVFTDMTAGSGLPLSADAISLSVGDYDNDGDPDLFIGRNTGDSLYENAGNGTFIDRTNLGVSAPSRSYGASFGDYNLDGWLDIYITVWDPISPNRLFRNNGDGTFTNVSFQAGVAEISMGLASAFIDYNDDGWPDIYTCNDKGMDLHPNTMYRNNGNGTFTDVAQATGTQWGIWGMGLDFVDCFNDGGQDLYCTDGPVDHLFLVDNHNGFWTNQTYTFGLEGGTDGWACEFIDFDNDGWQDLYVNHENTPNPLFHNPGQPVTAQVPWPNVTATYNAGGVDPNDQGTFVIGDFDNDGREDIINVTRSSIPQTYNGLQVLMNNCNAGNWIRFDFEGVISNRDGQGCKVRLTANGMTQYQQLRSGVGYTSVSDWSRMHFGLGSATVVDRVEVIWPSGQVQTLTNVPANQDINLIEPTYEIIGTPVLGSTTTFSMHVNSEPGITYAFPISLTPGTLPLPSGRVLPIMFDALTWPALEVGNALMPTAVGLLSPTGHGSTTFSLPNSPGLLGVTVYTMGMTVDPNETELIRTILPAVTFTIQ